VGGFVNFDSPLSAPADYVTIRANMGGPDTAADVADLVEGAPVLTFAPGTNFNDVTVNRR